MRLSDIARSSAHFEQIISDIVCTNCFIESFLNFVSESRDWAFEYIENVQAALNKFVAETDPSIEYFEKYGDVVAGPNNELLKKISVSYKELKNILPKDQDV